MQTSSTSRQGSRSRSRPRARAAPRRLTCSYHDDPPYVVEGEYRTPPPAAAGPERQLWRLVLEVRGAGAEEWRPALARLGAALRRWEHATALVPRDMAEVLPRADAADGEAPLGSPASASESARGGAGEGARSYPSRDSMCSSEGSAAAAAAAAEVVVVPLSAGALDVALQEPREEVRHALVEEMLHAYWPWNFDYCGPVTVAAAMGDDAMCRLLLRDPRVHPNTGFPLRVAVRRRQLHLVPLLLADPRVRANYGGAFFEAVAACDRDAVLLLGMDPQTKVNRFANNAGTTPLLYAVRQYLALAAPDGPPDGTAEPGLATVLPLAEEGRPPSPPRPTVAAAGMVLRGGGASKSRLASGAAFVPSASALPGGHGLGGWAEGAAVPGTAAAWGALVRLLLSHQKLDPNFSYAATALQMAVRARSAPLVRWLLANPRLDLNNVSVPSENLADGMHLLRHPRRLNGEELLRCLMSPLALALSLRDRGVFALLARDSRLRLPASLLDQLESDAGDVATLPYLETIAVYQPRAEGFAWRWRRWCVAASAVCALALDVMLVGYWAWEPRGDAAAVMAVALVLGKALQLFTLYRGLRLRSPYTSADPLLSCHGRPPPGVGSSGATTAPTTPDAARHHARIDLEGGDSGAYGDGDGGGGGGAVSPLYRTPYALHALVYTNPGGDRAALRRAVVAALALVPFPSAVQLYCLWSHYGLRHPEGSPAALRLPPAACVQHTITATTTAARRGADREAEEDAAGGYSFALAAERLAAFSALEGNESFSNPLTSLGIARSKLRLSRQDATEEAGTASAAAAAAKRKKSVTFAPQLTHREDDSESVRVYDPTPAPSPTHRGAGPAAAPPPRDFTVRQTWRCRKLIRRTLAFRVFLATCFGQLLLCAVGVFFYMYLLFPHSISAAAPGSPVAGADGSAATAATEATAGGSEGGTGGGTGGSAHTLPPTGTILFSCVGLLLSVVAGGAALLALTALAKADRRSILAGRARRDDNDEAALDRATRGPPGDVERPFSNYLV